MSRFTIFDKALSEYNVEALYKSSSLGCSDSDNDGDGFGNPASNSYPNPQLDCNDNNPSVNPDANEICDDGIDNDCDSFIDCNDAECNSNPICSVSCNPADTNCDGCITLGEMSAYVSLWLQGDPGVTLSLVSSSVVVWLAGGC